MKRFILVLMSALFITQMSILHAAQKLPTALAKDIPEATALAKHGEAVMRFVGLKVYDIRLWTPGKPHNDGDLFALELVYDLSLKGAEIAKRSADEMRKVGYTDEAKLKRWGEEMAKAFPDVKKGDTLIGVNVPGKGAKFYNRDKLIADIADAEFAKAFFDIWLSPKTSQPKLRTRLLSSK
jgi:Chalcone isomerase-like